MKNWKYHLRSSLTTFFAGFVVEMAFHLETLTYEAFMDGAWKGIIFLAVRSGFKMLLVGWSEAKK